MECDLGFCAVGKEDPRDVATPQLGIVARSALGDGCAEVAAYEPRFRLGQREKEHVRGVRDVVLSRETMANGPQVVAGMREADDEQELGHLPVASKRMGPAQQECCQGAAPA